MIDWKKNSILTSAIASVVAGTIIGGVWYWRESPKKSSETPITTSQPEKLIK
ncbi:MAG: hypothetical protein HC820_10415 [Hydrococcus sp. RM1_1_31]|nr:hypothetical protein [Hydrococcus sp. RM1_1_31]